MIRLLAALVTVAVLAGCTGGGSGGSSPSTARTSAPAPRSSTAPASPVPVSSGPTTTARADACPIVSANYIHFTMGVRLGRLAVLRSGGKVVGCRFYPQAHPNAQCDATCFKGEHLPPASQPVMEIVTRRYTSADGAHNAFVLEADKGSNPQQVSFDGRPGVCFQTGFYARDKGKDWACATSKGAIELVVHSVDTTGTFGTSTVTRKVVQGL